MKCLRCGAEMIKMKLTKGIEAYSEEWVKENGIEIKRGKYLDKIYVCDECGYSELSCKD